jgi:AcrR family transcriptional regulator
VITTKKAAHSATRPSIRDEILRVSCDLIEGEGLAALSMREVARRAGVSHQAPYKHFPDRESILSALVEQGFEILETTLVTAIQKATRSPQDRLSAASVAYVEFACDHPAQFQLMFRPEMVDLANFPSARRAGDRAFNCIQVVVKEIAAEAKLPKASEDLLFAYGWSVCHGLSCLITDGPLAIKLPNAKRRFLIEGVTTMFRYAFETWIAAHNKAAVADVRKTAKKPKKA